MKLILKTFYHNLQTIETRRAKTVIILPKPNPTPPHFRQVPATAPAKSPANSKNPPKQPILTY